MAATVENWSTQQLAEFLAVVTSYPDEGSATLGAVERAAEALEAEVAAILKDGVVVASIGFPGGKPPTEKLQAVADGALDLARLEAVGEAAQRDDGGKPLGGILRNSFLVCGYERHGVNLS